MRYFRILDDIHIRNRWILSTLQGDGDDFKPSMFTTGKPSRTTTPITVESDGGTPLDFTLAAFDVPIVTSRVARMFRDLAEAEVQLIPVTTNGIPDEYFILNAIHKTRCIDENKSVFTKWTEDDARADKTGSYRMVPRLVIDPHATDGKHVFRAHGWHVPLLVSEQVCSAFEHADFSGAVFQLVTDE